jgi:8-amino-7-oxononanoate synthase
MTRLDPIEPKPAQRRTPLVERVSGDPRLAAAQLARQIGRYPFFSVVESESSTHLQVGGARLINFGSNNYLGLTTHPAVVEAAIEATRRWGTGVTGSRFLNGNLTLHEAFEARLAAFVGMDDAIILPTGYCANLALLSGLLQRGDMAILDEEAHASLIDGTILSRASLRRFRHNDAANLGALLDRHRGSRACLIEGIYSMRGDKAPLRDIAGECNRGDATLVLDEAHSFGVVGQGGRGLAAHEGLTGAIDFITITFSKSLASCGGAILGAKEPIAALRISMRPFMFTASNTPASIASADAALTVMQQEPERLHALFANAAGLRDRLKAIGIPVESSGGPIMTVTLGADFNTLQAWKMLRNRGVFCNPVLSPAVPAGNGLLRLSIMATHVEEDLDRAADAFRSIRSLIAV